VENLLNLTILMMERVGLIIILAFFLVNVPKFRRLLFHKDFQAKFQLFIIFSIFTIVANLIGIELSPNNHIQLKTLLMGIAPGDSVANIRILTVTVSGIIGGPVVGGLVGIVAGVHRVLQESLTTDALFYIPSSVLIGILSGSLSFRKQHQFATMKPWHGFFIGLLMETIQMMFILIFSPTGWRLVQFIAIPMITISALGTSIFLSIISLYFRQEVDAQAIQTRSVLQLALKTLPVFRQGLNQTSAKEVVQLVLEHTSFDAVGIVDRQSILAFEGVGKDHHIVGKSIKTDLSTAAIKSGEVQIANNAHEINCPNADCPLHSAIVVPLIVKDEIIGCLKLYYIEQWRLSPVEIQLGTGLGEILAMQIMLGEIEHQAELVRDAEIKSLQAQVNPHFFFNAINTIVAIMRSDSNQARSLLIQLSNYFRANLMGARETLIPLSQEYQHVQAYLSLEQARFPGKYTVEFHNDASDNVEIPPFTIQILVENAIKHAFKQRKSHNLVEVWIKQVELNLEIVVADNGIGIDKNIIDQLGKSAVESQNGSGTALQNLNARLTGLYGKRGKMMIETTTEGTDIKIKIPYNERGSGNEGIDC
jgi:two-component system sensor histidine kinase LytS